jgi:hypothetical protein
MKKLLRGVLVAGALLGASMQAQAAAPGGPGGGEYLCFKCFFHGGWGPYVWTECVSSVNGKGSQCTLTSSGCNITGGCQSLPDPVVQNGLAL